MDISGKLAQANGRLRASNVGVSIEVQGNRLVLRGTFPPRPGSKKNRPYQQRLTTGLRANPAGVKAAELEARTIGTLLAQGRFSWEPYAKSISTPVTVGEWAKKFEADYFSRRERNDKTETTWRGDYQAMLKRLPSDNALTVECLEELILSTTPDTKTRKRACMVATALGKFAGLPVDFSHLSGGYSPRRVTPRDLPTDELIAEWHDQITNPGWKWVFGMMATYGLRNHEVFRLDLDRLRQGDRVVSVLEGTKTGERRVWACYPEWFDEFNLGAVQLPRINMERSNAKVGQSVSNAFSDMKIPFNPYDLRHCWAIRTLEFGLPVELAAQQMGHSVQIHTNTYHHWISDRHHQRAYELLMMRSDRPRPPKKA